MAFGSPMLNPNINLSSKTVLVTGAAGFIGANLVKRLFADVEDIRVVGLDSLNDYYDVTLKQDFGFKPSTPLREGLRAFARWYAGYYGPAR